VFVIEEEIEIAAAPAQVWATLADLDRWGEWQQFIIHNGGKAEPGSVLKVTLTPPGGRKVTFSPAVKIADEGKELAWHNRMMAGLFDTRHFFTLTPAGDGKTRFVQREEFRGGLVWLFRMMGELDKGREGFRQFSAALKKRVEAGGR
jgi:hypothetical protein